MAGTLLTHHTAAGASRDPGLLLPSGNKGTSLCRQRFPQGHPKFTLQVPVLLLQGDFCPFALGGKQPGVFKPGCGMILWDSAGTGSSQDSPLGCSTGTELPNRDSELQSHLHLELGQAGGYGLSGCVFSWIHTSA